VPIEPSEVSGNRESGGGPPAADDALTTEWRQGSVAALRYDFLIDTYATERLKVLAVWSSFGDDDPAVRPHPTDGTYGPTADTGGLMAHRAPTVYPYPDARALLEGEAAEGRKRLLPGPGSDPPTERPR
jgi:hypothetical protein